MKKMIKMLVVATLAAAGLYLYSIHTSHYSGTEAVRIDIPAGATTTQIAQILKDKSLINSTTFFKIHARLSDSDRAVKSGRYSIEPNLTPAQVLQFLTAPTSGEISITIPEGYTIFEIDEKLTDNGLINEGDFIAVALTPSAELRTAYDFIPQDSSLEGFLFPDTYLVFAQGFTAQELVEKMLNNFKKRIIDSEIFTQKNDHSLIEVVSMAAILEKEIRLKEDLPIASGLLWKRIQESWPLQVDASVLYERELAAKSATVSRKLSLGDLKKDSPYNTYTRLGLPPGPIGNPGLANIKAAINPETSEFWFYLTDSNGKAHFAKTNAEHEQNKVKWL